MSPGLTRRIDRRFRPEASLRHRHVPDPAVFPTETAKAAGHHHSCFDPMPIDMRMHPPTALPSLSITRRILPYMRFRPVSARPPLSQKLKEEPDCLFLPREMMLSPLTSCTDAAPSADETGIAEQIRFNRHGIVAGHVFLGVDAFDIELVALRNHDTENRAGPTRRPTTCLNRSVSIDSC